LLGCNRNMVIGKVHRMKLELPNHGKVGVSTRRSTPRSHLDGNLRPQLAERERLPRNAAPDAAELRELRRLANEPESKRISALDIRDKECHWPHGDAADLSTFHLCGHDVAPGKQYCPHHAARAVSLVAGSHAYNRSGRRR
jgi:hypothetical protein